MDWLEIIRTAFPIIGTLFSVAVFVFMLMARDKFVSKEDHKVLDDKVALIKERLNAAETALQHVPRSQALHELAINLEKVNGSVKSMSTQVGGMEKWVKGITAKLGSIEDYLLKSGNRE